MSPFANDSPIGLVADIGGTNVRFALAGRSPTGELATDLRQDLRADDHPGLAACIAAYLDGLGPDAPRPTQAAFGVASPVTGDLIRLTNRDWSFSIQALRTAFGWSRLVVVNEFAIVGHAVPALRPGHWRPLTGPAWPDSLPNVVTLIGPGTGLGVGSVARSGDGFIVIPSEGGHASFAPLDALEIEILRVLLKRFPRVSNERLLSGPGLQNLYEAMGEIRGQPATLQGGPAITQAAKRGNDPLARDALERFGLILGGAMGDVALTQGGGAVAIAGGIAPRMLDFLDTAAVRARFEAKGRAHAFMAKIPIAMIAYREPALLGAARLLFGVSG